MTELPSNDYISQINQNGSGLNIPQIVGALVDANIEPVKSPVVAKIEKVDTAISGLAILKQSSELTKTNLDKLKSASFFTTSSSDAAQVASTVTDEALVKEGTSKVNNVTQLAQAMSFSIPAAGTDGTAHYTTPNAGLPTSYNLTIKIGTFTDNNDGSADTFAQNASTATTTLNLAVGEGIGGVASKLDAIDGLNARVVLVETGKYKILITGEPGASNAFEISTGASTGANPASVSVAAQVPNNGSLTLGGSLSAATANADPNGISETRAVAANGPLTIGGALAAVTTAGSSNGISLARQVGNNGPLTLGGSLSAVANAGSSNGISQSRVLGSNGQLSIDGGLSAVSVAANANGITQSAQVANNADLNIDGGLSALGAVTLGTAQKVTITSGSDDSGMSFRVYGTNAAGANINETVTGASAGGTAVTSNEFKTISRIEAVGDPAGTVTAGVEAKGSVTLATTQKVTITSGGNDAGIQYTVVGTKADGGALSETVTGAGAGGTAITSNEFKTITSITAVGAPAGTVTAGVEAKGSVTLGATQKVTITSGGDDSGIQFTVVGTKADGSALSETVTGAGAGGTAVTSYEFKTITSITAVGDPAGTVTAGVEAKGAVTNAVAQKVTIASAGNDAGIQFTVVGTNAAGQALSETVTGAGAGGTATTAGDFLTITSITAVGAPAGTVTAGVAAKSTVTNAAAKKVTLTSAGNDAGIQFTVVGTKADGSALIETITGGNASMVTSTNEFKTITSITAIGDPAGTVSAGIAGGFTDSRAFDVWNNTDAPATLRTFDQAAKNLVFKLDGVDMERDSNIVTDAIPGISFEVKVAGGTGADIKTEMSKASIQETVQKFVDELNAYKADLKALSLTDRTGAGEHGDLSDDAYIKSRIRALSDFMLEPIRGYTSLDTSVAQNAGADGVPRHTEASPVYLSTLGIKTQKDGTYGLDQTIFDSTFKNAPTHFNALVKDQAYTDNTDFSITWDGGRDGTKAGIYLFHHEYHASSNRQQAIYHGQRRVNHAQHIPSSNIDANGEYTYAGTSANSVGAPGLSFRTTVANPSGTSNTDNDPAKHSAILVYLGKSFSTLFSEFHDNILNNIYDHRRQVENYTIKADNLERRLAEIEIRRNSLAQAYNKQFQSMEESVTGFKSTGNFLTGMVDAWNEK